MTRDKDEALALKMSKLILNEPVSLKGSKDAALAGLISTVILDVTKKEIAN